MDPTFDSPESSPSRAAAEWVARRDRGLTPGETIQFAAWRSADPRHAEELARLEGTWMHLDATRSVPELEALADALVARARRARSRRRFWRMSSAALAAAAAVAVAVSGWNHSRGSSLSASAALPSENYQVVASTVRRIVLPDGSMAELNGASQIAIDYSETSRRVRLIEGEAHFIVAKNPARPFFVAAGPVTVRAVGTAFNVRLASAHVEVLVTEGSVNLASEPASAASDPSAIPEGASALVQGQRAVISLETTEPAARVAIAEVPWAEIDDALGWQSTRLVFNHTPLPEVVEGFNRYNSHRLTIGDPKLRQRALTGVFRADNLEGFVRLLQASIDVKAEMRTSTETVLLPVR